MPYKDNTFDLTFSIGLLEHFDNYDEVIKEQVRVLAPGGMFIGYVVPDMPNNIQKDFEWINRLLRTILADESIKATDTKSDKNAEKQTHGFQTEVTQLLDLKMD